MIRLLDLCVDPDVICFKKDISHKASRKYELSINRDNSYSFKTQQNKWVHTPPTHDVSFQAWN